MSLEDREHDEFENLATPGNNFYNVRLIKIFIFL